MKSIEIAARRVLSFPVPLDDRFDRDAPEWPTVRRHPRAACERPILAKLLAVDPVEEFGTVTAIGLGGCGMTSTRPFGPRALVELQIPLASGVVAADGRVAYEIERGPGSFEIGIEFLRVSRHHRDRIKALFD